jgi:glycolate oxidase iron-sulfur subunit
VAPPRRLLASVPNLTVLEIAEGDVCCGSAGTYNLERPETAAELGQRKADRLLATEPDLIAAGNIGCLTQIRTHLTPSAEIETLHTVALLDRAYDESLAGPR